MEREWIWLKAKGFKTKGWETLIYFIFLSCSFLTCWVVTVNIYSLTFLMQVATEMVDEKILWKPETVFMEY